MRRVKGKLCRNAKGQFTRCRGGASSSRRSSSRGKRCMRYKKTGARRCAKFSK